MRSARSRWFKRFMGSTRRQDPGVEAHPTLVGWQVLQAGAVFGIVASEATGYGWTTLDNVGGTCLTFAEAVSQVMGVDVVEVPRRPV
jgi:hypothetical protein